MTARQFLAGCALFLAAACGEAPAEKESEASAPPLLWEVASASGEVEGWLYGTIHALPDGTKWNSPALDSAVEAADYLIVEVAALEDGAAISRMFTDRATTPDQPYLWQRVEPGLRKDLAGLAAKTPYSPEDFTRIESWAAAIILAQAASSQLDSANGVDKALIRRFAGREIAELEGAQRQFEIFDALAETDQREMLVAVVEEAQKSGDAVPAAVSLWLAGDEAALARETRSGILADPEIYQALLADRNRAWAARLEPIFGRPAVPLVAVGAAHLVGDDSLVALLRARGFTVRRIT